MLAGGHHQPCGNRVQLEDAAGNLVAPLPDGGDVNLAEYGGAAVGETNPVDVADTWVPIIVPDVTANDSDKTLTVPVMTLWQVLWIRVELTTTATAGDRQLAIQILDTGPDVIAEFRPRVTQAASLAYVYQFAPGMAQDTAVYDTDLVTTPLPPTLILDPEFSLRIYDNNAVDAAADDMVVQLMVARRAL
jgi:hypothetical protein